jgi:hypothetical protein
VKKLTVSGSITFSLEEESAPGFIWSVTAHGITTTGITMLALPNDHKVTASIQPVDAKGNPAQIDGQAQWSSSSPSIANVQNISTDTLSAEVIPGDQLGSCQINVQADADLGSGIQNITGVLDVQVVAGAAVGFTISTSVPEPVNPGMQSRAK